MKKILLTCLALALLISPVTGQDPARFKGEIDRFLADTIDYSLVKNLHLFTGSSSIRMWSELKDDFPDLNLVNTGFGGSQMSDLLHYADLLIIRYHPSKVVVYEGDNDVEYGKGAAEIIADAEKLLAKIRLELPEVPVYFITAKPSPARWHLMDGYLDYNRTLLEFTKKHGNVSYIDVWEPMLGADGEPRLDIFLEDRLHLNRQGYDIWKEAVAKALAK
ncbi:MAG: GDSL-type esterase/lipase family protein [Bacteroidales bacterium]